MPHAPSVLAPRERSRIQRALLGWYRRSARSLPWRRIRDPYAIWVSETMLQQTTVETVVPYYRRFLARYPDILSLARAREDDLLALWSGLGYYRRARNMRAAAARLVELHGSRLPEELHALRALPGIGRYTAGAIASIAFGARTPVVDGNVARVLSRLFALRDGAERPSWPAASAHRSAVPPLRLAEHPLRTAEPSPRPAVSRSLSTESPMRLAEPLLPPAVPRLGRTRKSLADPRAKSGGTGQSRARPSSRGSQASRLWRIAEELVPANRPGDWNQALMELGARICRPLSPSCSICPIAYACRARALGEPSRFSPRRRRPPTAEIRASLVVIERGSRVLFVRRPEQEPLGGLWELPGTLAQALRDPGLKVRTVRAATAAGVRTRARIKNAPMTGGVLAATLRRAVGFEPQHLERVGSVRHAVTHRRLTIDAWRATAPARVPAALTRRAGARHLWADPAEIGSIPLGAASRKVLDRAGRAREPKPPT